MATKKDQKLVVHQPNRENIVQNKKVEADASKLPKARPALRDVGNKVQLMTNVVSKLGAPPKATEKAPTNVAKAVSKVPKSRPLKREESVVIRPSFSQGQMQIYDPDKDSKNDPNAVTEYIEDIYDHLKRMEQTLAIDEDYLKENHRTTPSMRAVLVDWLADVQQSLKVCIETFHMAVAITDRYLQKDRLVGKETLQLVGISAMMIASKYEEIFAPDVRDFVYLSDDTFSTKQILDMEKKILAVINFSLGRPTSIHFLRRYSKIARVTATHHNLGKYLLELALLDYNMCHIRPSYQAAAACCLSLAILNEEMDLKKVWTPTLEHYTGYKLADFRDVIISYANLLTKIEESKHQVIRQKFAQSCFGKISTDARLKGRLVNKLVIEGQQKKQ